MSSPAKRPRRGEPLVTLDTTAAGGARVVVSNAYAIHDTLRERKFDYDRDTQSWSAPLQSTCALETLQTLATLTPIDGLGEAVREARGLNALFPHPHAAHVTLGGSGNGSASPKREASPVRGASPARVASPTRPPMVHIALKPTPPEAAERAGGAPWRLEIDKAYPVKESLKTIRYYWEPNGELWVLPIHGPDAMYALEELQECAAQVPFSMVGFGNAMEHARRLAGPAALHSPVPPTPAP